MSTSHRELDFSLFQNLLILKVKYFGISLSAYHKPCYKIFIQYSLLERSRHNPQHFVLNEKGKMYLRYKFRKFFSFWIPTTIAIIALFGGYDVYTNPVLKAILESIASLFETIMENLGVV